MVIHCQPLSHKRFSSAMLLTAERHIPTPNVEARVSEGALASSRASSHQAVHLSVRNDSCPALIIVPALRVGMQFWTLRVLS